MNENTLNKADLLARKVQHIDITRQDVTPLIDQMGQMAYSARDLHRAAGIYNKMLQDHD